MALLDTGLFEYGKSIKFKTESRIFNTEDSFIFNMGEVIGRGCSSGITGNLCGGVSVKNGWSFDEFIKCKSNKIVSSADKNTDVYKKFKEGYDTSYNEAFGLTSPSSSNVGCNTAKTGCKCGHPNIKNCDPEVTIMDFSKCECSEGSAKSNNTCKKRACMDETALNYANPNYPASNPLGTTDWADCNTNFQGKCYVSDSSLCQYSDDGDNGNGEGMNKMIIGGAALLAVVVVVVVLA